MLYCVRLTRGARWTEHASYHHLYASRALARILVSRAPTSDQRLPRCAHVRAVLSERQRHEVDVEPVRQVPGRPWNCWSVSGADCGPLRCPQLLSGSAEGSCEAAMLLMD